MSQRSRRSFLHISTVGAFACLLACGGGDSGSSSPDGTLVIRTAAQAGGMNYRLSGASFQVAGAETVTLSTPNPPSGIPLQEALTPGQYTVTLQDGWVLEQQTGATFQTVTEAMITSMNPASVNVVRGQLATIGFVIVAGTVTVDFAQGGGDDDGNYD